QRGDCFLGAGTCYPTTGLCSNSVADGTAFHDGHARRSSDLCQAGSCVGADPVVCAVGDQCHGAGICDPTSGVCSNPVLDDGTACTDGDACTQSDSCQAGTCVGTNPVVCTASDQCHTAGTCDPATGTCSGTPIACDDGDPCATDTCDPSRGCVATPLPGFAMLTCIFDHAVESPVCAPLAPPVAQQIHRAAGLVTAAASSTDTRVSRRQLQQASDKLRKALKVTNRLLKKGKLSPECAAALRQSLGDSLPRITAMKQQLKNA